jgi:hypothetical protein
MCIYIAHIIRLELSFKTFGYACVEVPYRLAKRDGLVYAQVWLFHERHF